MSFQKELYILNGLEKVFITIYLMAILKKEYCVRTKLNLRKNYYRRST